jgi:hypothetical protein
MAWRDEVAARLRSVNAAAGSRPEPIRRANYWSVVAAVAEGMAEAGKGVEGVGIVRAHLHELVQPKDAMQSVDRAFDEKSTGKVLEALGQAGIAISPEEQEGLEAALIQAFRPPPGFGPVSISAAWLALHRAEEDVLLVCSDAYAGVQAIELKGRISRLKGSNPTVTDFQAFLAKFGVPDPAGEWPPLSAQARDWLRMILHYLNASSDHYQDQLRVWRNGLWGLTALMTGTVLVIGAIGLVSPYTVGVCGPATAVTPSPSPTPSPQTSPAPSGSSGPQAPPASAAPPPAVRTAPTAQPSPSSTSAPSSGATPSSAPPAPSPTAGGSTSAAAPVCLDGSSVPSGRDWLFVLLFGLAGALLSAVVTFRNVDSSSNSYRVQWATTVSKIPLGVVVAAMGVFAVQRGLFDILQPQSGLRILAFAFAFGFGQQAFTQALDSRTNALLGVATATSSSGASAAAASLSADSSTGSGSRS